MADNVLRPDSITLGHDLYVNPTFHIPILMLLTSRLAFKVWGTSYLLMIVADELRF